MTNQNAALLEPSSLPALLKRHLPFLHIDTLKRVADVVCALIQRLGTPRRQAQSTRHTRLAPHLPGTASFEAKKRRAKRCFQDQQLDGDAFVRVLIALLPPGKLILALDRTFLGRTDYRRERTPLGTPLLPLRTPARNWKFGQCDHNVLVIGVLFAGYAVPLVWQLLDHGGASSAAVRIALLDRLLKLVSRKRVRVFLADREFIGAEWFAALRKRRVKRCIRLRDDSLLDDLPVRQAFGATSGRGRCGACWNLSRSTARRRRWWRPFRQIMSGW